MKKTRLELLRGKLERAGLKVTEKQFYPGISKNPVPVLSVDAEYDGPYPTKDCLDILKKAGKMAKGFNKSTRGYYQALWIWE